MFLYPYETSWGREEQFTRPLTHRTEASSLLQEILPLRVRLGGSARLEDARLQALGKIVQSHLFTTTIDMSTKGCWGSPLRGKHVRKLGVRETAQNGSQ